jgi:hypothetical protein
MMAGCDGWMVQMRSLVGAFQSALHTASNSPRDKELIFSQGCQIRSWGQPRAELTGPRGLWDTARCIRCAFSVVAPHEVLLRGPGLKVLDAGATGELRFEHDGGGPVGSPFVLELTDERGAITFAQGVLQAAHPAPSGVDGWCRLTC